MAHGATALGTRRHRHRCCHRWPNPHRAKGWPGPTPKARLPQPLPNPSLISDRTCCPTVSAKTATESALTD
eukprot:10108339-Alexandrium_andersonii.AAC.1